MIEDVLLTREEIKALIHKTYATSIDCDKAIAKAAQLKLLDWQSERCTEHTHMKPLYRESNVRRWACPQCDAELRKELE